MRERCAIRTQLNLTRLRRYGTILTCSFGLARRGYDCAATASTAMAATMATATSWGLRGSKPKHFATKCSQFDRISAQHQGREDCQSPARQAPALALARLFRANVVSHYS